MKMVLLICIFMWTVRVWEVFAKGNTVAGANQIFPSPRAVGASVLVEGGPAKANIAIYPIKSTWTDKKEVTKAVAMNTTVAGHLALEVGQSKDLQVYLAPASEEQDVTWTVSDPSLVSYTEHDNKLLSQSPSQRSSHCHSNFS